MVRDVVEGSRKYAITESEKLRLRRSERPNIGRSASESVTSYTAAEFLNRDPKGPSLVSCETSLPSPPSSSDFPPCTVPSRRHVIIFDAQGRLASPSQIAGMCLFPTARAARKKKLGEKRAASLLLRTVILTVKLYSIASFSDKANSSHRTISGNTQRGGQEMHFARIRRSKTRDRSRSWYSKA